MITDIPTPAEFHRGADDMLHASWASLVTLLQDAEQLEELVNLGDFLLEDEPPSEAHIGQHWELARPRLTAALALVQQAAEFYLKARIATVSPYLLIKNDARLWPKGSASQDCSFADFKTVDAQDLVRIANTVSSERVDGEVEAWLSGLRGKRNRVIHTVDRNLVVSPASLAETILLAHEYLVAPRRWVSSRLEYLGRTPEHGLKFGAEGQRRGDMIRTVHEELAPLIRILPERATFRFFGLDRARPALSCPQCERHMSENQFFDSEWLDGLEPTLQRRQELPSVGWCLVCETQTFLLDSPCERCGSVFADGATSTCLICAPT